jgi:hypothetical protein
VLLDARQSGYAAAVDFSLSGDPFVLINEIGNKYYLLLKVIHDMSNSCLES